MRLSTEADRDAANGIAVLHSAFDAGVTLLDTADAYCLDDSERGHNERLIAAALASWGGDRSKICVATKGGLVRPGGRWEADGRARALVARCRDSCRALGVERIQLYQLHAPDPRTAFSTSVRAMAALKCDGLIESIGLCNVTVRQIDEARRIADIDSIQIELSVWHDEHLLSGVVEYCIEHRLPILAYRPLGGPRRVRRTQSESVLADVARRHEATPCEIALAWLMDLSELIVPIPGATRVETIQPIVRAQTLRLTGEDREALDERFPFAASMRGTRVRASSRVSIVPRENDGEVVLVMGLPGAGKSAHAEALVERGYHRLNRDVSGGTLKELLPAVDVALSSGVTRIVLDNTYVSRKSRAEVIRAAEKRGVAVRCIWLTTSVEDAQTNAAWRIVSRYGALPGDAELDALRKHDVAAFLPSVQFRYQRALEPPEVSEGFSRVDVVQFKRRHDPSSVNRAVIVWCDDVLLRSREGHRTPLTPEDVDADVDRAATLRRYLDEGYLLLGMSWQPAVAESTQSLEGAKAVFARLNECLGLSIEVELCPHAAGPPRCWCRKPLPGLGVLFLHRHKLDPAQCIYVGAGPQDPGFARRLGFQYRAATEFFR